MQCHATRSPDCTFPPDIAALQAKFGRGGLIAVQRSSIRIGPRAGEKLGTSSQGFSKEQPLHVCKFLARGMGSRDCEIGVE